MAGTGRTTIIAVIGAKNISEIEAGSRKRACFR
jgi:hypothetical protein